MYEMTELELTDTESLVKELHKRFDVFFMAGMLAQPSLEEEALHYWASAPLGAAATLVQYALSHYQIQAIREHILEKEDE